MSKSPDWTAALPPGWDVRVARRLFRERRQSSLADDVHLTPSQHHGVLPQAEYMQRTGSRVVLNLTGADNMKHVEPDDFVIHLRSFQGGIEHSPYRGKVSYAYTVFAAGCEIEPRYYKWVLKSQPVIEQLASTTDQLRDGQSIKFEQFASLMLPVPPLDEQRRIANYLDDQTTRIDQAIQLRQQQIAVVREAFQALLAESVQEMRANRPSTRLSRFFRSVEQGASPNGTGDSVLGQEPGVIKTSAIKSGVFHWKQNKALMDPNDYDQRFEIHPGDLLVVRGSGSGDLVAEAAVVTDEVTGRHLMLSDLTYRLSHLTLVPEFVSALFAAAPIRSQIRASIREGSGPAKVRGEDLGAIRVPVVREEEQLGLAQEFMEYKSQLDRFAELAMKSLAVLRERKEALISEAVTGRLEARST